MMRGISLLLGHFMISGHYIIRGNVMIGAFHDYWGIL